MRDLMREAEAAILCQKLIDEGTFETRRKELNLGRGKLGAIGVWHSSWELWLSGRPVPASPAVEKLAELLGLLERTEKTLR